MEIGTGKEYKEFFDKAYLLLFTPDIPKTRASTAQDILSVHTTKEDENKKLFIFLQDKKAKFERETESFITKQNKQKQNKKPTQFTPRIKKRTSGLCKNFFIKPWKH